MEQVPLGTKVKPLGINRTNVADGITAKAVLLDPNPRVKYIGWDDILKRKVELNQEMVLKYGFRPMTNFYYLIARLNTDMNGNVVNGKFVVEYLQLSENINNEFSDAVSEIPDFTHLSLTKVTKKSGERDFSYIRCVPSMKSLPKELLDSVEKFKSDKKAIESIWQLIDKTTSMSASEYIAYRNSPEAKKILQEAGSESSYQKELPASSYQNELPAPKESAIPQSTDGFAQDNDFGDVDDFGSGF